jgi:hypothetical protein
MFMGPMSFDRPPIVDLLFAMSVVGMLVGLIWLHRITGLGADPGRSIFRYRDRDAFWRLTELLDLMASLRLPSLRVPKPIRRRLTVRWLVTRLELALAVACLALAASPLWLSQAQMLPMAFGSDLALMLGAAGTAGCTIGLVWMIRIARRPAESGRTIWRAIQD